MIINTVELVKSPARVSVVDTHTGGEPTRVIIAGGPELRGKGAAAQLRDLRERHDQFRSAVVNEPRGSGVLVGALLVEPMDPTSTTGVIYFNSVGYLGMCGHGTMGVIAALAHLGRIEPGEHRIETAVGTVTATLHPDGWVSVENVPSYREVAGLVVNVPEIGDVVGDVAWGGNWFFLVSEHRQSLTLPNAPLLTEYTNRIRQALVPRGFPQVDHVELFGPASSPGADSRNFVMCPGGAYDRSPCGTGTSAKLACLAADGKVAEGETWTQESIIGSIFRASYRPWHDGRRQNIIPTITGSAFVNGEGQLLLDPADPFCWGLAP